MLSFEWREFEQLSARIGHLRIRRSAAASSRNVGLIKMLTEEIANAERHRDQLVGHMSTRMITPA